MQGLIYTLFAWMHRFEAAFMARFKEQPILTVTTCLAIVALPFLLLPYDVACAVIGIPLLPFALVYAIENQGAGIDRQLNRQDQVRKERGLRALKKKYGPRRRP